MRRSLLLLALLILAGFAAGQELRPDSPAPGTSIAIASIASRSRQGFPFKIYQGNALDVAEIVSGRYMHRVNGQLMPNVCAACGRDLGMGATVECGFETRRGCVACVISNWWR